MKQEVMQQRSSGLPAVNSKSHDLSVSEIKNYTKKSHDPSHDLL